MKLVPISPVPVPEGYVLVHGPWNTNVEPPVIALDHDDECWGAHLHTVGGYLFHPKWSFARPK